LGDEVESFGGGVGEVDDAVAGCRAVVVDGDADGFSVAQVGDAKFCAAAECGVGSSQFGGGIDAATGRFVAFEGWAVEGGVAAFSYVFFRLWPVVGRGWLSGGRFLKW
jgi:hypothetical protein